MRREWAGGVVTEAIKHEEAAGLLGAYALDALDETEVAGVEAHLVDCPRCRSEVADHRMVVGLFSYSGASAPQHLWARLADLSVTPPPAPGLRRRRMRAHLRPRADTAGPQSTTMVRPRSWRQHDGYTRRVAISGVGCLVVAAVALGGWQAARSGGLGGLGNGSRGVPAFSQPRVDPAVVLTAVSTPGARLVRLAARTDHAGPAVPAISAVLLADGTGYLLGGHLAPLPMGQTYQLWGQVGSAMVSYGLLGPNPGTVVFRAGSDLSRLAVSAEPAGGVVVSHHLAVVSGPVGPDA